MPYILELTHSALQNKSTEATPYRQLLKQGSPLSPPPPLSSLICTNL